MKKLLTKNDIKNIAKAYNLTENEQQELASFANDLNNEQKQGVDTDCSETHFALFSSVPVSHDWQIMLRNAATAVVLYLAKRMQNEMLQAGELCGKALSLTEISYKLARLLGCYSDNLKWFFINASFSQRWNSYLYTAHKCGLDTLELN